MATKLQKLYTVKQVAHRVGLTDSRVRQICREHSIGIMLGRDRLLTGQEITAIKKLPDRRKKRLF